MASPPPFDRSIQFHLRPHREMDRSSQRTDPQLDSALSAANRKAVALECSQGGAGYFSCTGQWRGGPNGVGDREFRPVEEIVRAVMSNAEPVAKMARLFRWSDDIELGRERFSFRHLPLVLRLLFSARPASLG